MSDLLDCPHCKKTGTCANGPNGVSCARCTSQWASKFWRYRRFPNGELTGLVCSVCWGKGVNEGSRTKWDYRFPVLLAAFLSGFGFITLLALHQNGNFDKVLVFVSTLLASITGFYFGGERARQRGEVVQLKQKVG